MADVVIALDLPTGREALNLVERIPSADWVKVGSVLFTAEGPPLIRELRERGLKVFLDLKWHDIPNTVGQAASAAAALDVQLATVHALGGQAMMQEAVRAAEGRLQVVAVTILTAHQADDLSRVLGRPVVDVPTEVERLADLALSAGCAGVVTSPLEVARLRDSFGASRLLVVPGIRRPRDLAGDQRRTGDPAAAARAGGTHLVVGRPILQASDPEAVHREIRALAKAP